MTTAEQTASDSRYAFNKLQKKLRRETGRAVEDFNMIAAGDRIMVCLSGGKDSYTLLDMLVSLQRNAPIDFSLVAVNLDQKQPGFPEHILPNYLQQLGVPYHIVERDTFSIVQSVVPEGKTTCGVCSKLRRGTLYAFANRIGCNKVALGHHRDDILETFFLNLFFAGKLKAMPPKLLADSGQNILIRPLAYCRERDIARYATLKNYPIIPCNLCGSQDNLQRQHIKAMLKEWDKAHPGRSETIFRALQHVSPSQLVDPQLFDFAALAMQQIPMQSVASEDTWHPLTETKIQSWKPTL